MDLDKEIENVLIALDDIDKYCNSLSNLLSLEDQKTQDLLHYIENNKINAFQSYRLVKQLKKIRLDRRNIKNNIELAATFYNNKNKLIFNEYRSVLKDELKKTKKQLQLKYKNRYYQQCEIVNIIKQ
nr:MAG TPA: hypothetical protein [Caudoviricetes sp.]